MIKSKLKMKIAVILLAFCVICGTIQMKVLAAVWRGAGTSTNPYLIETAEQLFAIPTRNTDYFKLANDIDLKDYPNRVIEGTFSGIFDGDNHKITNFKVSSIPSSFMFSYALFPTLQDGTIKNLIVESPNIECNNYGGSVSIFVGMSFGNSKIQNCHVVGGEILQTQMMAPVSGIISYAGDTLISRCSSTLHITSRNGNGYGITSSGGKIENCFVAGTIWAKERAYGIGCNANVTNSYFAGQLFASTETIGISQIEPRYLVYKKPEDIKMSSSYFDKDLLPITTPSSQARSTSQMFTKSNYEGWNFDTIWGIDEGKGYPYLRSAK